ncbi:hypothetical protein NL676_009396 [Syzygium grande]|nr:hypothetical protein NL676_009396 [Syzygium grande]
MSIKDLSKNGMKLMMISHRGNLGATAKIAKLYVTAINTLANNNSRKKGRPQFNFLSAQVLVSVVLSHHHSRPRGSSLSLSHHHHRTTTTTTIIIIALKVWMVSSIVALVLS